jgi:perosamine synthetase
VILPGLTCVVVPNAILYAGLVPVYIDIDSNTYNLNSELIEDKITDKTKVIIIQNTFGLSTDVEKIIAIAQKYQIVTIDDCTHGFGGRYKGKPNGSLTDAVFYSSQWNKPFSTVIGGYLMVCDHRLIEGVKNEYVTYSTPTFIENIKLVALFYIKKWAMTRVTYWPLLNLYRWLSRKNLILGSSQKDELIDIKKPKNYEKKMGWFQKNKAIKALSTLDSTLSKRKKNAAIITAWLKKNNKNHVKNEYCRDHSWLKYPIRVKDRALFFKIAESKRMPLGDWFVSPIHPVLSHYDTWCFDENECPNAVIAAKELVNLPTDLNKIEPLILFLDDVKDHII